MPMNARTLIRFLLGLIVIESILIIPWPGVAAGHRALFVAAGNLIVGGAVPDCTVRFQANPAAPETMDVTVEVVNARISKRATIPMSSRQASWMSIAFAIALALATPLRWQRRLVILLWVFFATGLFAFLRAWIGILVKISNPEGPSLLQLSPTLRAMIFAIDSVLTVPMIGWYVVPLLIWLMWLIGWEWPRMRQPGNMVGMQVKSSRPRAAGKMSS